MGTDFSIKPVGAPVATPVVRPLPDAARTAVPTELPPPKTITAPETSAVVRNDQQATNDRLSNEVVIDRAAASIVYRVVDNRTSLVVRQYPDEARLRAKAYFRTQDEAKLEKKQAPAIDQRV